MSCTWNFSEWICNEFCLNCPCGRHRNSRTLQPVPSLHSRLMTRYSPKPWQNANICDSFPYWPLGISSSFRHPDIHSLYFELRPTVCVVRLFPHNVIEYDFPYSSFELNSECTWNIWIFSPSPHVSTEYYFVLLGIFESLQNLNGSPKNW
jgi:hypothetical protein